MSNSYVVTSATYIPGSADPLVTVVGTVNGTAVTVTLWLSAVIAANNAGGIAAVKNLVSPLMLAAIPAAPVAPANLPTGSWSQ